VRALVFYASLLAHELSHSLVARRSGVKMKETTLWMFGGVSKLEGEPGSARAEALITAVGPATRLVLAALAYVLALATAALRAPNLVVYLLLWLTYVNAALGFST
jgi:Zn-dependent protease